MSETNFKDTVILPKTDFSMRGNLAEKEPSILETWKKQNLYQKIRQHAHGREKFILHFGPPYANGSIHIGHALSEVLKDVLNKMYQMSGFDAPLVPGWDCHGLPVELKVEEEFKKNKQAKDDIPIDTFLKACRDYAEKWISTQREDFERLGIIADWHNPYKTFDFKSEAVIAKQLLELMHQDQIYRGLKPVLWSVVEKTALAEAEVEYHDHKSDAIYITFPIQNSSIKKLAGAHVVIWTTTPWTIPCNRAISYNNEISYALIKCTENKKTYLIANDLLESFVSKVGIGEYTLITTVMGRELKDTICFHPLRMRGFDFDVPLLHGEHVTTEVGTGLVHTAPSHGVEDFEVCQTYGISAPETVLADGTYANDIPYFAGDHIYKVAPKVINALEEDDQLVFHESIIHSYPHSWRSKAPLIYRATAQWFVNMDDKKLRAKALEAIEEVRWTPSQGKKRITAMVANRPDWCISRQRSWGVPIALFINQTTRQPLKDREVDQRIINTIENEGIEAWHQHDDSYFLGEKYDSSQFEKVTDILDVWFDSACTQKFVLNERADLAPIADVYFEGSDQHRGWFQSSLMLGCLTNGHAPYKNVITHGFVLDDKGYKMSKSQGNVTAPQQIMQTLGADILRLWIVNSNYEEDLRIGSEILKRQEDVYRRYRNTLRYLLGALDGFEQSEFMPYDQLPDLEKYILHSIFELDQARIRCLSDYNFSTFYHKLHNFCSLDLSSFYFDIRKDSLYCDDINSPKRRATRTVISITLQYLVRFLAPALSFTTEEVWSHMPSALKDKHESIHLTDFLTPNTEWHNIELYNRWEQIRNIKRVVTGALEIERANKTIGSSLQAEIDLFITPGQHQDIEHIDWAEITITSKVNTIIAKPMCESFKLDDVDGIGVQVQSAEGEKCARCWKIDLFVSQSENKLCMRCHDVVTPS